jgi:hypothetical protein
MSRYTELVGVVRSKLAAKGYGLRRSSIRVDDRSTFLEVSFPSDVFALPLIAIPDVHLGDASGADIFANGRLDAHRKRLFDFLHTAAYAVLSDAYGGQLELVQLGDWYDIWRAYASDLSTASFLRIETPYRAIVELDADIGLKHLIGNHDAVFARGLSQYRSSQPQLFPFGSWLAGGTSVFGIHGHQSDAMKLDDAPDHPTASRIIAIVSSMARASSDVGFWQSIEDAYDKHAFPAAVGRWAKNVFLGVHPDAHEPIEAIGAPAPSDCAWAPHARFAINAAARNLVSIVEKIPRAPLGMAAPPLRALVVGHSHIPRISWVASAAGDPVVVIDVGSWAYGASNVLLAAGDAAGVFDVTFGA